MKTTKTTKINTRSIILFLASALIYNLLLDCTEKLSCAFTYAIDVLFTINILNIPEKTKKPLQNIK